MRSSVKRVRRAAIEALEGRRLMTATIDSFTLDNYEAPIMSGSEVVLPGSLVEGMNQTASLNFHTDHDNLDGGVCHVHFDYGDPNCPAAQNSSDQWVANYAGASHVYNEAGTYVMTATVTDTAGDGTTYTWTAGSDQQAVYVAASEGTLSPVTNGGDFSFEPNSTFALPAGAVEFSDSSAATLDPSEYTGTIDWGDGATTAASFAIDPGTHGIEVLGFHTYSYVMDPNTGDVAEPLSAYGENYHNPINIQVQEAGGGAIALVAMATVNAPRYLTVGTSNPALATTTFTCIVPTTDDTAKAGSTTFFITGNWPGGPKAQLPNAPTVDVVQPSTAMGVNVGPVNTVQIGGQPGTADPCTYSFSVSYLHKSADAGANTLTLKIGGESGFTGVTLTITFATHW